MPAPERRVIFGVLAGGAGRRMGGVAKGDLRFEGVPLVVRTTELCRRAARARGDEAPSSVVLVGSRDRYAVAGVPVLADDPEGVGPIGGLRALLTFAAARGASAIALGVDMPYLDERLLARLVSEQPEAAALAPKSGSRWQPLFARYEPARALPVVGALLERGESSMQRLLTALDAAELALDADEAARLADWDTPEDMRRTPSPDVGREASAFGTLPAGTKVSRSKPG